MSGARPRAIASSLLTGALVCHALACATPAQRVAAQAERLGFPRHEVVGTQFRHVVFGTTPAPETAVLHVYLGGDGSPARAARQRPADPTPAHEPMLRLMALDPRPHILLGRPCYYDTGPCDPVHWTLGRYGEPVVASMLEALQRFARQRQLDPQMQWVLIGFSGGGTLAMLMAERLPGTRAVVTLAGNLDTDAWAEHHGYRPLTRSQNPAVRPALAAGIAQLHLRAGRDANVPPHLGRAFLARQPNARALLYPDLDHSCCWEQVWPSALRELERGLQSLQNE